MGVVRIIGGACRRRIVRFPNILGLRPTSDRVRETLFNWLGRDLTGWSCLDLFAGSGVLGLEASSRGAASVVLVDSNLAVCRSIEKTANELKLGDISVVRSDALMFLNRISRHEKRNFDLVFIDPPFRQSLVCPVLSILSRVLRPAARVYVETEHEFVLPDGWVVDRQLRAGQVLARLLLLKSSVGG